MLHEYSYPVASGPRHLHFKLIKYLDSVKRESCSLAELDAFKDQNYNTPAHLGVKVKDFHYTSKHKNCVCRCQDSTHGYSKVRSPYVIDMCAEYFSHYKGQLTCTKAQWRSQEAVPPFYGRSASASNDSLPPYQDFDTVKPARVRVSSKSDLDSSVRSQLGRSDMPVQVWDNARPAVWSIPGQTMHTPATPLGTAHSPCFPTTNHYCGQQDIMSIPSSRASRETTWSEVQEEAAGHTRHNPLATTHNEKSSLSKMPMAEMPTDRTVIELDVSSSHVHDQTLRRLEGRTSEHALQDLSQFTLMKFDST